MPYVVAGQTKRLQVEPIMLCEFCPPTVDSNGPVFFDMSYESILLIRDFDSKQQAFNELPWMSSLFGHVLDRHNLFLHGAYANFLKKEEAHARKDYFLHENLNKKGIYAFS